MKKVTSLWLITLLFFSCNKHDDLPLPDDPQFNKVYGGSEADFAYSITRSRDGGYAIAGQSKSNDGDATGNHGGTDAWVIKLDKEGKIMWQTLLGGSGFDHASSIVSTSDDGYVISGSSILNGADAIDGYDAWIVKLDRNGSKQWEKKVGGSKRDWANSIINSADNGYVMTGYTASYDGDVGGNHGGWDVWVVKLDPNGIIIWQKTLGGPGGEWGNSITKSVDGGYVVAGQSNSYSSYFDIYLVKLDPNGNLLWQRTLGGAGPINTIHYNASFITTTSDSKYILAGFTYSSTSNPGGNFGNAWVGKLDDDGTILWQKTFGGAKSDVASCIVECYDGNYIMAGSTGSNDGDVSGNNGLDDAWIVKLNRDGNKQWQETFGGSGNDVSSFIIPATNGRYVMAGYTSSNDGDVRGNHGNFDVWIMTLKDP